VETPEVSNYTHDAYRAANQQKMASRRALEWIGTSKPQLAFRYENFNIRPTPQTFAGWVCQSRSGVQTRECMPGPPQSENVRHHSLQYHTLQTPKQRTQSNNSCYQPTPTKDNRDATSCVCPSLGTRPFAVRRKGLGTRVHPSCPQDGTLT